MAIERKNIAGSRSNILRRGGKGQRKLKIVGIVGHNTRVVRLSCRDSVRQSACGIGCGANIQIATTQTIAVGDTQLGTRINIHIAYLRESRDSGRACSDYDIIIGQKRSSPNNGILSKDIWHTIVVRRLILRAVRSCITSLQIEVLPRLQGRTGERIGAVGLTEIRIGGTFG